MLRQYESPDTLLIRLKEGDSEAQKLFWQRSWNDVYTVTLRILENSPDATEVAVDVLSDFIFDYVQRVRKGAALQAYLRIVAARRAVRFKQKKHAVTAVGLDVLEDLDARSPEASAEFSGMVDELNLCLEQLTPKAQQVLRLRYHRDYTTENIGVLVGGSKQYIGRLITRSVELLRDCLTNRVAPTFFKRHSGVMP